MKALIAVALLLLAASANAGVVGALVDIAVYDRTAQRALPVHWSAGSAWVAGAPGNEYAIRIRNRSGADLLAAQHTHQQAGALEHEAEGDQADAGPVPREQRPFSGKQHARVFQVTHGRFTTDRCSRIRAAIPVTPDRRCTTSTRRWQ